jgi:regulator of protease activity HflC (stomatin/prohibitin superfamily)
MNKVAEAEGEARSQVARAHGEATSLIERAHGEAEANRLRQASITPQLMEWRRLENQRVLFERWNGELPKTVLGEKSNLLLSLYGGAEVVSGWAELRSRPIFTPPRS